MAEVNYWNRRWNRRSVLRGGVLTGLGLAGAALIGCGSDEEPTDVTATTGGSSGGAGGASATATEAAGTPKRGGSIRVLTQSGLSFQRVDPVSHSSQIGDSAAVGLLMQEHLMAYDSDTGEMGFRLAESIERPDETTYVVHLKPGAHFQDGNPVTAEDIAYSMSRHNRELPDYPLGGRTPLVLPEPEVVDDLTAKWTLAAPYPDMIYDLAGGLGAIVSKKSYETTADPYGLRLDRIERPVTAAPYIVDGFIPRERIDVVRYDDYWDGGPKYLDAISTWVNPEDAVRVTQLVSGEADLIGNVPPWDIESIKSEPSLEVSNQQALKVQQLIYNTTRTPFGPSDNPSARAFRRALLMAIDREALVQNVWSGIGAVADSFMHPVQFGYQPQQQAGYDPEGARALLEQNGWDWDYEIKFLTASGTFTAQNAFAEAMAQMLTDIGLKVSLNIMSDYPAMTQFWIATDPGQLEQWDFLLGNLTMAPESANRIHGIVGDGTGYGNLARWSNPQVFDLMEQVVTDVNDETRAPLLHEVQRIAAEEAGISGLTYSYFSVAWNKRLKGMKQPREGWDLRNAWLEDA